MSNYQVGHPLITIWAWPAYKAGATHLDGAYDSRETLLHFATNCAKEAILILIYLGQCMVSEGYQRLQISLAHEMLRAASRQGVTVLQFDQGSKQTPVHSSEFGGRGHTKLGRPPWCFLPIWIRCCMLPSDDGGKDGTFDGRRGTDDSTATREAMTQYDPTGTSRTSAPCCSNTSLTHT